MKYLITAIVCMVGFVISIMGIAVAVSERNGIALILIGVYCLATLFCSMVYLIISHEENE